MKLYLFSSILTFTFMLTGFLTIANTTYESEGNDMANISLKLKDNGKFQFIFEDLKSSKPYKFKGKWKLENGYYKLKFSPFKKIDLAAFFGSKKKQKNTPIIIEEKSIQFPSNSSGIWIWEIYCQRKS